MGPARVALAGILHVQPSRPTRPPLTVLVLAAFRLHLTALRLALRRRRRLAPLRGLAPFLARGRALILVLSKQLLRLKVHM